MQYFVVYFDAADYAINRVGPFDSTDAAVNAALARHGMPDDAVLPSEICEAVDVDPSLPLITIQ